MENDQPKRITIDDLAAMVAKGFADVEVKIDAAVGDLRTDMNGRLAAVETGLSKRIDNLSYKVDQIDQKLDTHRQESKTDHAALRAVVGGMSRTLTDHEERIKALEGD